LPHPVDDFVEFVFDKKDEMWMNIIQLLIMEEKRMTTRFDLW